MKRFSKSIFLTILVIAMAIALVGCKSAQVEPLEPVEPAPVEQPAEQPAETPAEQPAETPAEEPAAPAEAPAEEPAEAAFQPIERIYVIADQEIIVKADVGRADVTYPADIITDADLVALLETAVAQYPFLLDTVRYEFIQPGHIVLTYPETWGYEVFAEAEQFGLEYVAQVLSAPAAEPEAPAEAPVEVAELPEWTISLYGYEAKIVYENKVATIIYPSFITNAEILEAAQAVYAVYGAYLQGTELAVDNGVAWLKFPADLSYEDLDASVRLLAAELPGYVATVLLAEAPAAAAPEVEETAAAIERTFSILGYEASIVYQDKVAVITYPDFITNAEVAQAAKTAYAAYGKYLQGSELTIDNGTAVLTFPVEITADDIDFAVALLSAELPAYVASVLEPQPVATVAEAPAAEAPAETPEAAPAEAAPAAAPAEAAPAEQPAASTPAATTTTTPAATTTTTPAASTTSAAASTTAASTAAQTAKKSNTGLIIVIIVLVIAACAAVAIILKKKKK